jgi:hypothetical protein
MIKLPLRRFIATAHPPCFIDANRLRPHWSLSFCPSNSNPHSLQDLGHVSNFSHASQIFQFDRSFTSAVPPWKNGRHAFSIGTPPECVSENPRSDCF